jgi:hypothetical protein
MPCPFCRVLSLSRSIHGHGCRVRTVLYCSKSQQVYTHESGNARFKIGGFCSSSRAVPLKVEHITAWDESRNTILRIMRKALT